MTAPVCRSVRLTIGYIAKIPMHPDASDVCDAVRPAIVMQSASQALSRQIRREQQVDQQSERI